MHEEMTKEQLSQELEKMRLQLQLLDSCRQEVRSVQRKYDRLLQSTPDAMLFVDGDARIVLVNQQLEKLFGYTGEELVGQGLHILIPERFRGRHQSNVANYFSNPRARPMGTGLQIYGLKKDGSEFPADIALSPLEADKELLAIAAIRDITERKQAEEAAAEGQKLRLAQEVTRVGTYEWDIQAGVIRWTPEMETLYGLQPGGFGKTYEDWARLIHPDDRPEAEGAIEKSLRQGTLETEFRTVRPGGAVRWLAARGVLFRDGSGKPLRLVGVNIDVTERREAEEKVGRLLSELERSNEELEQFAYVASHDLQEPLRMIASYVQLLEQKYKGKLDEKADKYIYFALDGALRMQKLIEDLLTYSRVTTRGAPFGSVDTNGAFTHAVLDLTAAIEESHGAVTKDDLPTVTGDETQFSELFQNLIGNAIKFRRPNTAPLVHVSAKKDKKEWLFSIRDNGIGIEPKYFDRIFQIFQRLHTRAEYPGTGIGLALCKRIVERHGGRIRVESVPGEGTTFFFTIPMTGGSSEARER